MNKNIAECVDNARQCAWYASKTKNEAEQKFLILLSERWIELAAEKERELRDTTRWLRSFSLQKVAC
jgi:hypothetical protein